MLARELAADESLVEPAAELTLEYGLTPYMTPEVALADELYSEQSARVHLAAAQAIRDWVAVRRTSGRKPGSYFELWVSPWGHVRCTCPTFVYRGVCEHAQALTIRLAKPKP